MTAGKQGGPLSMYPMHYWPATASGLGDFACSTTGGFRSSSAESVTCPDCRLVLPLVDRRQRALESFHDVIETTHADSAIAAAIETATRVKITHDIVRAFIEAPDNPDDIAGPLEAAFRAAGFEVEQ